jgi:sec-independent protein translocase protein TatA
MGIGSLGISELMVIFVIVLVFFGPRRFPEIARSMGSAMREFRRSLNQIQRELEEVDPRKDLPGRDILNDIRSGKPGNWLDPNRSNTAARGTPGTRSTPETTGPQVTGEAAAPAAGDQLPMFDSPSSDPAGGDDARSAEVHAEADPGAESELSTTEDSRSD